MASIHRVNSTIHQTFSNVASDSLIIKPGDFIQNKNWFIVKCGAGDRIDWMSHTDEAFTPTNETVENAKVVYLPNMQGCTFKVKTTETATQSNVWFFFQMDVLQNCDIATASTSTWVFKIISVFPWGQFVEVELTTQGS